MLQELNISPNPPKNVVHGQFRKVAVLSRRGASYRHHQNQTNTSRIRCSRPIIHGMISNPPCRID
eukprot:3757089-Amphidinium_carterae.1